MHLTFLYLYINSAVIYTFLYSINAIDLIVRSGLEVQDKMLIYLYQHIKIGLERTVWI